MLTISDVSHLFLQMCHHRDYSKQQVYEAEHGVCQLCGVDAQSFFDRIRSAEKVSIKIVSVQLIVLFAKYFEKLIVSLLATHFITVVNLFLFLRWNPRGLKGFVCRI